MEEVMLTKYFLGDAVPPNDVRTRRNGDKVFHQTGLQRNVSLTSISGQLAHTDNTQQTRGTRLIKF